jgi:hypothetical protein
MTHYLENTFIEYLVRLPPRPEYVALFREIVVDVWHERHVEAAEALIASLAAFSLGPG